MEKRSDTPDPVEKIRLETYDFIGEVDLLLVEEMADIATEVAAEAGSLQGLLELMDEAGACHNSNPDLFFPEQGGSTKQAKAVCGGCVIRRACLCWGVMLPEKFGVWGGSSDLDRRDVRRQLRARGLPDKLPLRDESS
ncbi:WhiB family transcriptional regulator [Candidatus Saccharibacteria bacterium]|nr:WhiB family transcriptional regulator [Candidatus Saccharibacteria bacterium]